MVSVSRKITTLFIEPISHCSSIIMIIWMLTAFIAQLHLQICMFSLYIYVFISTCLSLSVSSCLTVAAAGAMANHLIPNALLRPHGTNNPYNTLLGESAVYNNPLGMYNTQGVLAFHSLTLWPEQCFVLLF